MNNFIDAFRFHFTQIWYCVLLFYVIFVNPTESGRAIAVPWICLGLVGVVGLMGDCLSRLELLRKRLQELEVNAEEKL